jgi:ATP-dependent Clp protease ATP-binding subunit ClpA
LKKVKTKAQNLGIKIDFDKTAITELVKRGFCVTYGAREVRRMVSTLIEDMLATKILTGELNPGDDIIIKFNQRCGFFTEHKKAVKTAKGANIYGK